jgi:hypothetical protein
MDALRRWFDEKRYADETDVRQELIVVLADHGDYRGLPELFDRVVKAVDDSTLPKDAKAREQEAWKRDRIVWDLARSTIPGHFSTTALADFLRPRTQSSDHAVRQAVEKIFEFSRPVEIAVKAGPAIPEPMLASPEEQAMGRATLRKLREANRVWLVGPSKEVRSYAYDFRLGDRPATRFEVTVETSAGAERQGISYDSAIHRLIQTPDQIAFRHVQVSGEKIILSYLLAEPVRVAIGNGIRSTWTGYFSMGVREGTLVVDAKRLVPLEHSAEGLHETYAQYVDLGHGCFAPLRINVDHSGMAFTWTFRVYEPGLWLFSSARYDTGQAESKVMASIDKVQINGGEAKLKHSPTP